MDRRKIAKDLINHRSLWQAVLTDDGKEGTRHFVRLRELENSPDINVLYVEVRGNKRQEFEKIAEAWNLVSVQFLPNHNAPSDEVIAELFLNENFLTT